MALIFIHGICGMSYGKFHLFINSNKIFVYFSGLFISAMCEQEVEVMEVALGSVFPILLSSG